MKILGLCVICFFMSFPAMAQNDNDFFDDFMSEEMADFDKFIDDANMDFINFMRDPWKEFEAEKPIIRRTKPEPVKPIVYDTTAIPKDSKPLRLTIEEILDQTSKEGKQKPEVDVADVDDFTFKKQNKNVNNKKPVVVTISGDDANIDKPVIKPEQNVGKKPEESIGEANTTIEEPVKKPVIDIKPDNSNIGGSVKPDVVRADALYAGGTGRMPMEYGGQTLYFKNSLKGKCRLTNLKENAIADAYEGLYKTDYKAIIDDCRKLASDLDLNDWGVFTLVRTISDKYCSNEHESVVMQQFLLNEMGYKVKMARNGDNKKMLLFVATDCILYGCPYMSLDGTTYYSINDKDATSFYMCRKDAPNAKNKLSMSLDATPKLGGRIVSSVRQTPGGNIKVAVDVPEELMNFYNTYPQCDYGVYFNAPVNSNVANALLTTLKPCLAGKSESEAAGIIINFVQMGFEYKTDGDQFGYEKPFFVEELFYYPYCDCEDRAILFSYLIRNLLHLDVVLVEYPNHMATAVRFNDNVGGDYIMVSGEKYIICDPTYMGASIGQTMPQFRTVAGKVLRY